MIDWLRVACTGGRPPDPTASLTSGLCWLFSSTATTNRVARKASNVASNPRPTVSVSTDEIDFVLEGASAHAGAPRRS
jgi:hypothetical protein